jgi:hypothetical protein
MRKPNIYIVICGLLLAASAAHAQATRTWVSGVGDDANPCSRTAPCKTFAGAISKTATNGAINVLDPGGFGAVTITKSITIDGAGGQAGGILSAGTNGIIINNAAAQVVIRNVVIDGAGTGINGINVLSAAGVILDNVRVSRVTGQCVNFAPTTPADSNLAIRKFLGDHCGGGGIWIVPGPATLATVSISDTRIDQSQRGIRADDGSDVSIVNTIVSSNTNAGFISNSVSRPVSMSIENSVSDGNIQSGVRSFGAQSSIRISSSTITNNTGLGLETLSGGQIRSFGNNRNSGNYGGNGVPTSTLSLQ